MFNRNFNQNFNQNFGYAPPFDYTQFQPMQTIQTIRTPEPQVQTLFVNGASDLDKLQIIPNTLFIGINKATKEVYIRQMNNDGLIELNTYVLANEKQEKSELKMILERIEQMEQNLKGKDNERNVATSNGTNASRRIAKPPHDADISTNDAE